MSGLFAPKPPQAIPVVNPSDVANRANNALARQLAAGGTNADTVGSQGNMIAPGSQARPSTLAGIG